MNPDLEKIIGDISKSFFFIGNYGYYIIDEFITSLSLSDISLPEKFTKILVQNENEYKSLSDLLNTNVMIFINNNCDHDTLADVRDSILSYVKSILQGQPESSKATAASTENVSFFRHMSEGQNFEHIPLLPELRYDEINQDTLDIELTKVNFSTRFHNVLRSKKNIKTIGDLLNISFEDLIKYRNCGEATINEVRNVLRQMLTTD